MGLELYSIFNLPPHWRDENEQTVQKEVTW